MITNDGLTLKATTPEEIIDELHRCSFSQCASRKKFMEEVASRTLLQTGQRVRVRNPEEFVADLISTGLLSEEETA